MQRGHAVIKDFFHLPFPISSFLVLPVLKLKKPGASARVPKNTYPVRTEHALSDTALQLLHASLVYIQRAAQYRSTRTETLAASLAQRVWCVIKAQKKIFRGQGGLDVLFGIA